MLFQFQPFPELTTERLFLRQAEPKDIDLIFFLRSDQSVMKYINRPVIEKRKEAEDFLKKLNAETKANESIFWAISVKPEPKMIGAISLWNFSEDLQTAEIGYSLHPDYQNHGYMTEALVAVLKYGFETLHFQIIEAFTNRWNEPSKRMLVKTGFTLMPERVDEGDANNSIYVLKKAAFLNREY